MDDETLFDEIFIDVPDPARTLLYTIHVIHDDEESNTYVYSDSNVSLSRMIRLCSIAGHVIWVKDNTGNTVLF